MSNLINARDAIEAFGRRLNLMHRIMYPLEHDTAIKESMCAESCMRVAYRDIMDNCNVEYYEDIYKRGREDAIRRIAAEIDEISHFCCICPCISSCKTENGCANYLADWMRGLFEEELC